MASHTNSRPFRRIIRGSAAIMIGAAILTVPVACDKLSGVTSAPVAPAAVHTVSRNDMLVSITEGGTIEALREDVIRNEVPGQSRITFLVPEGTNVKTGDLLVELDSSDLETKVNSQQITVQKSLASAANAEENLSIKRSQNESNIREAELKVQFAKLDLEKYRDGDYPQQVREGEADITIAEAELERSKDALTWTEKLQEQGYATRSELEADRLTVKRKELDLQNAKHRQDVLKKYEYVQKTAKLEAEVKKAEEELERVKRRAAAEVTQAEADLESNRAQLELNQDKLQQLVEDYKRTRIVAPQDGMVVYSSGNSRWNRNSDFLEVGASVNFRQELLKLPDLNQMKVEVKIHEARVNQIEVGQPVVISIDTLPDRVFQGRISKVAVLPDAQSSWLNPDLKVYTTTVLIEEDLPPSIKPGVSTKVQILVAKLENVITVPLQSVVTHSGQQFVFQADPSGELVAIPVRLGLFNESVAQVEEGLEAGTVITLEPPKSQDVITKYVNLVAQEEIERIRRAPPKIDVKAAMADDDEEAVELPSEILEQMPEDRRQRMEERWATMTNDERRDMIQRMRSWQNGDGRRGDRGGRSEPGGS